MGEEKNKLINLYKEMLKYAGKKYQEDWDFKKFTEEVSKQYSFFNEDLYHVYEALQYKTFRVDIEDDVCDIDEKTAISLAEELYEELLDKNRGYKFYAFFYPYMDLVDGENYWDIYLSEKEHFVDLFKSMLDYRDVEYKEDDDYNTLLTLVLEEYPAYKNKLLYEIERHNIDENYLQIIKRMRKVHYEVLKTYRDKNFVDDSLEEFEEWSKDNISQNKEVEEFEIPLWLRKENYDFNDEIEATEKKYEGPISEKEAFEIANRSENLKTDYFRRSKSYISYLYFSEKEIKLVEINDKKYWQIQILAGEVSGIDEEKGGTTYWDGDLGGDDFLKLRCLVDVETGEYTYYPSEKKVKKRKFFNFGGFFKWK